MNNAEAIRRLGKLATQPVDVDDNIDSVPENYAIRARSAGVQALAEVAYSALEALPEKTAGDKQVMEAIKEAFPFLISSTRTPKRSKQ